MTRADKAKPIPHDSELASAEQRRRDELAKSGAYQRGVAQAKENAIRNDRLALDNELANLKRATVTRDENGPRRDAYNRTYDRVVKAAERLALATGQPVSGIPAWLAPPAPTQENSVTIAVPKPAADALLTPQGRADLATAELLASQGKQDEATAALAVARGKVAKPSGLGKSGKGGPAPNFADPVQTDAWLNVQGRR